MGLLKIYASFCELNISFYKTLTFRFVHYTKKYCMNLIDSGDDGSNKNYQVIFFETKKLTPYDFESICSSCVSDEDFKKLRKTIEQNGYDYEEEVDSVAAY